MVKDLKERQQRKTQEKEKCKKKQQPRAKGVSAASLSKRVTRSQKNRAGIEGRLQTVSASDSSSESEAECPKCGLVYGEDYSV